jgi:acyl-coenzyme A thioesterase PaaI-like protein
VQTDQRIGDDDHDPRGTAELLVNEGPGAIVLELAFESTIVDDEVRCRTESTPEVHGPGTDRLRTSVVAALVDVTLGNLAVLRIWPRNAMTTHLEVHLHAPLPSAGVVEIVGRPLRFGRTLLALEAEITHEGSPLGIATVTFVPASDPSMVSVAPPPMGTGSTALSKPLAERAGLERLGPGQVLLPDRYGVRNGGGVYSGALLAVLAEEAALSLTPGASLASLSVSYLSAIHLGPAVATAQVADGVSRVEVRDTGRDDRLATLAMTRTFGP